MKKHLITFLIVLFGVLSYSQNDSIPKETEQKQTVRDTIPGEAEYRKHYNCTYEEGNILIIQKKGKNLEFEKSWSYSSKGFVIRMEGIYDLEFSDGKRYRSGVIKKITTDSISISTTMNESAAKYEGIDYKIINYSINDIRFARFLSERALGIFKKINIQKKYDLIVKKVDKAKLCPAVLTFTSRNNEVKVCHYYLTKQGYNMLFESDGYIDFK